ncbi:MAG: LutC/YkgG family protein [Marmoricola sp.]
MSSAREEILARVRAALTDAPAPPPAPAATPAAAGPAPGAGDHRQPASEDLLRLFVERVEDYRARVLRCGAEEVSERIAQVLEGRSAVVPADLAWPVPGARVDGGLSAAELDAVDAVVTGAAVGIAETGTVVLDHGRGQGRRLLSLVPDLHVCVVVAEQVVADVPDAVARLGPAVDAGCPTTWISGPSATSDIELSRVEGVHGPRTLVVLLVG